MRLYLTLEFIQSEWKYDGNTVNLRTFWKKSATQPKNPRSKNCKKIREKTSCSGFKSPIVLQPGKKSRPKKKYEFCSCRLLYNLCDKTEAGLILLWLTVFPISVIFTLKFKVQILLGQCTCPSLKFPFIPTIFKTHPPEVCLIRGSRGAWIIHSLKFLVWIRCE